MLADTVADEAADEMELERDEPDASPRLDYSALAMPPLSADTVRRCRRSMIVLVLTYVVSLPSLAALDYG